MHLRSPQHATLLRGAQIHHFAIQLLELQRSNEMVAEVSTVTRRRIQRFWARSASGAKDLITCSQEHLDIAKAIIENDVKLDI